MLGWKHLAGWAPAGEQEKVREHVVSATNSKNHRGTAKFHFQGLLHAV